eukprot:Blabericola_migrator_1__10379@NODE_585_length_7468_cov_222_283070_g432_i0_p3_GENE_NODE_585_length_7468_cov_222_283070_g432_i0NODE_585_length_7468_cov_222_283070_g432_i0_p3_ORF_typecomplete_len287_score19_66ER_lumen_recept/PF00810_18/3_2e11PQloop/PF04193_14/0_1PQloop/PF04193_14/9_3e03PQloop/PF04193_14/42DUF1129/PF06570_11/65DUF1129/PF06570_11/0_39Sulf_transp/PF04143_14/0_21DUF2921/PF11145_8/1_6e02DUF2921/PF11145_8/0_29MARVEL/PF01284_23/0_72MARVEL/PF01284_23/9_2e02_NODE_585_length_7468_cov_222_283
MMESVSGLIHETLPITATVLWLIAYAALLQKLRKERSAQGISLQSLLALAVAELLMLISLACIDATPKFHSTVSLPLLACQGLNTAMVWTTFVVAVRAFAASYQAEKDTFGKFTSLWQRQERSDPLTPVPPNPENKINTEPRLKGTPTYLAAVFHWHWITLYVLSALFAGVIELVRPSRGIPASLSYLESLAGMILALAFLPQSLMFYTAGRSRISPSLGRFIAAMLLARLVSLVYWVTDRYVRGSTVMPGRGIRLVMESLNIILLSDFTWSIYGPRSKKHPLLPI